MTAPNLDARWDLFWAKVDASGDCWEWTACRDRRGYGQIKLSSHGTRIAHRIAWEMLVGPIPAGMVMDHLCRNHGCVNPDHLEPVTNAENTRRGFAGAVNAARLALITHCPQGHEYTPSNVYIFPSRPGKRRCLTCKRERDRARERTRVRNRRAA